MHTALLPIETAPPAHLQQTAGFSVLEIILSAALGALFVSVFVGALITSRETALRSGDQTRAVFLAEEGLEAARSIRDRGFSNLTDGSYGIAQSSNQWILSDTQDATDIFTRQTVISSVDSDTKKIDAVVSWQRGLSQTGSTTLTSYLTRWRELAATEASYVSIDVSDAHLNGNSDELREIILENTGPSSLTLTGIQATWNSSKKIERIKIDETIVWSKDGPGSPDKAQKSVATLTIEQYVLAVGASDEVRMKFSGDMDGKDITIAFTFGDASTQSVTIENIQN